MPVRSRHPLHQSPFFKLRSKGKLAHLVGTSERDLRRLCRGEFKYSEWDEKKKNGGLRHIENPHRFLKIVQARIARRLCRIEPPNFLFCPVKGRSYVDNAARHCGARVVRTLDICRYFPSTLSHKVYWFFRRVMHCTEDVSIALTTIATYEGHLPTGSPLSPILAFFAHMDMWQRVAQIAEEHGLTLTVYIDDVTLSGNRVTDRVLWEVKRVIHASGLRYHKEKRFIGRPADITGVLVDSDRTKLPQRGHKKIHDTRQQLLLARLANDSARLHSLEARLRGLDVQARQLERKFK